MNSSVLPNERHNGIRDYFYGLMQSLYPDEVREPKLRPLTPEQATALRARHGSANTEDGAGPDVAVRGFLD
jgi:hypothetical protein